MAESAPSSSPSSSSEGSETRLRRFFETSEASRRAASSLRKAADVRVQFTDVPGDFRFHSIAGRPAVESGKATDPEFAPTLSPGAEAAITGPPQAEVGELGLL